MVRIDNIKTLIIYMIIINILIYLVFLDKLKYVL